ncbi:hypothetical protein B0H14DRAFT_3875063 [Mycena olivaceomarginata]|nr:hypothetical protein B0H14DRAFT_3875063 [Mycena olivaceomarginata]
MYRVLIRVLVHFDIPMLLFDTCRWPAPLPLVRTPPTTTGSRCTYPSTSTTNSHSTTTSLLGIENTTTSRSKSTGLHVHSALHLADIADTNEKDGTVRRGLLLGLVHAPPLPLMHLHHGLLQRDPERNKEIQDGRRHKRQERGEGRGEGTYLATGMTNIKSTQGNTVPGRTWKSLDATNVTAQVSAKAIEERGNGPAFRFGVRRMLHLHASSIPPPLHPFPHSHLHLPRLPRGLHLQPKPRASRSPRPTPTMDMAGGSGGTQLTLAYFAQRWRSRRRGVEHAVPDSAGESMQRGGGRTWKRSHA